MTDGNYLHNWHEVHVCCITTMYWLIWHSIRKFLAKHNVPVVSHTPYSPHLDSLTFLFLKQKCQKAKRFQIASEIILSATWDLNKPKKKKKLYYKCFFTCSRTGSSRKQKVDDNKNNNKDSVHWGYFSPNKCSCIFICCIPPYSKHIKLQKIYKTFQL
jgi:hypothetical protein